MLRELLKSKIHRATITTVDLHYEGSLSVDQALLEAAAIVPYEAVHVWNVNNGQRLMTYAVPAPSGSGEICLNGAAARLGQPSDTIIIATFCWLDEHAVAAYRPRVVLVDSANRPVPAAD